MTLCTSNLIIRKFKFNTREFMTYQSESINELASALSKAQGEMQAAIKDSVNPFFKSKYADLGSVWDAARPVLSKHGLCIMQCTEIINDKIIMVTILAHTSGQWIKSHLPLNPAKNDSQGVGAAITYLRRYSLSALVGVVCDDDDDGETAMGRGKAMPKTQHVEVNNQPIVSNDKITDKQLNELIALSKNIDDECRANMEAYLLKEFQISDYADIPQKAFQGCLKAMKNNIELNKNNKRQQVA